MHLGPSGTLLGPSGALLGVILGGLGHIWGSSWFPLGASDLSKTLILRVCFVVFDIQLSWDKLPWYCSLLGHLGLVWGPLGAMLGRSCSPTLAAFGPLGDTFASFDVRNLKRASRSNAKTGLS